MPFYSDIGTEPKRSFRYTFSIAGIAEAMPEYTVVSTNRPTFQMEGGPEIKYIQHTFKYPGRVMWQDVNVTVVDPGGQEDNSSLLMNVLASSGYSVPRTDGADVRNSISKSKANTSIGIPRITQIDANGKQVDQWSLHNAFITQVQFGELNYESDDIVKIQMTFKYDYATFQVASTSAPAVAVGVRSKATI